MPISRYQPIYGGAMNKNTNVIDMMKRRNQQLKDEGREDTNIAEVAPILDMTERRTEVITEERRKVKRTILAEFVGAFVLIPNVGLQKVNVFDISESGLSFDLDFEHGHFNIGEEFAMRLYLSNDTYMPFTVRVTNHREVQDEGVHRHGVQMLKDSTNQESIKYFVKFLETVTASLQTDKGDRTVSKIK